MLALYHWDGVVAWWMPPISSYGPFCFAATGAMQLVLLSRIHELVTSGGSQFIIATHSPIVMAYPEAT
jgi:hypothetical protein